MDAIESLGRMDIYLLDQLMRGNVRPGDRVLDVGCGSGRNLTYMMAHGFDVWGLEPRAEAVARVREVAEELEAPSGPERFRQEAVERCGLEDGGFDVVLCNAVLHFADDAAHFRRMVERMHGLLRPGGLFFGRLATSIGIESALKPCPGRPEGWVVLPDTSSRFVVDLQTLLGITEGLGAELVDPIKTVNVQGLRCMSNWVWRRR